MTLRSTCLQIGVIARKVADKYNQFGRMIFGPKVLLVYLFIVNLFIYFDRGVVSGILRALEAKWGLSQTEQGALGSAFMVGYMIFGPIFAQLASKIPMKIVIFVGLVIWSVLTILCGFTSVVTTKTGFYLLAVCRCLVGVGEAAYAPVAPTLLDDVAPVKSRTMYMSFFYLAMPVGVAIGYGVSGVVADYLDWSLVFMGEGILIIPLALLILMVPPSDQYRKDRMEKEDRERLVNENNSLLENNDSNNQIPQSSSESNIITESDAMSQFGDVEKEKTYNIFQAVYHLFTNSVYVYALLGYTMYTFVIGALAFWGPTLVSKGLHIRMSYASLAFSGISVVTGIVGSMVGGVVLDKIGGSKGMAGSARGLMLCGIFIFLAIPFGYGAFSTTIIPLYFTLLVVAEFFIFCITSPVNVAFLSVVSPNLRNYSMSIQIFVIHAIGDFPSPSAMGAFADYLGGTTGLSKSILFLWTILIFSVAFFFVGFLIARSKSKIEERSEAFADLKKENYQRAKTDLKYATFNFNQDDEDNYEKQPGQSPLAASLEQYNVMQYDSSVTFISGYGQRSFFVGNTRIFGSIFATKKQVFVWDVSDPSQITIESLKLAEHLNPTPTLLLVGTGKSIMRLPQEVHEHFRKNGVVIEEMNSVSAVSTFNVLNQEGRDVCCACISLEPVDVTNLVPEKSPVVFLEIRNVIDRRPGGSPLG